jgi:hypothetical protein
MSKFSVIWTKNEISIMGNPSNRRKVTIVQAPFLSQYEDF